MPPESERRYFVARLRGVDVAAVGSIPEGAPTMAMWNTYFWVDSADETASKFRDAGGSVVAEPVDVPPDAGRTAVFTDPEGAAFRVWQAQENKGAQVRHRAWFVEPQRPQHPRRGSREVVLRLAVRLADDHPGRGAEMWTQPGFGDFLERANPDLRKKMAAADAPKGFEDVVGSINPIPDDQPDTPAHWSVTFAVADADATAAKPPSSTER